MTTVTYLGPTSILTEQAPWDMACIGKIDPAGEFAVNAVSVDNPAAALGAVRRGKADFACTTIESSVGGPVTPTPDALVARSGLQVFRETEAGMVFLILVCPGATAEQMRTFTTHSVAYPQVKQWVDANLPGVEVHQTNSNVTTVCQVAEGIHDTCAVPARAGELLGLEMLATEVADTRGVRTCFLLVGRPDVPTPRTGVDRTPVSFTLPSQPGTLMRATGEFAVQQVNLTCIESRPTQELPGLHHFYIDCNGHADDAQVAAALATLHEYTEDSRYLGSQSVAEGGRRSIIAPLPDISQSIEWVDVLKEGRRQNMTPAAPENPVGQLSFLDDRLDRPGSIMPVDSQRIIFIRHEQTTGNVNRRLDAALPGVPLTDPDMRQACSLGHPLLPDVYRIGDAVASYVLRVRRIGAGVVASLHRLGETPVRAHREDSLHRIQADNPKGRNDHDAHMEYMYVFYQWPNGGLEYRLPGGESGADVLSRYLPTLQQLLEQVGTTGSESRESREGGGKDVVIVSHGAVIRLIGQYLTGVDPKCVLQHCITNTKRIELIPNAVAVGKCAGVEPGVWDVRRWDGSKLP